MPIRALTFSYLPHGTDTASCRDEHKATLKGRLGFSCHAYSLPRLLHISAFAMDFTYIHKVQSYSMAGQSVSIKRYSTEHHTDPNLLFTK